MVSFKEFLLREAPTELDYQYLSSLLSHLQRPRNKITQLLREEVLIRVKKGLYVINPEWSQRSYSIEKLANLIYGPSYLSCETALSYYGWIPEQVHTNISMTLGRRKHFKTPVGEFIYQHSHPSLHSTGVCIETTQANASFLIATPEKALIDLLFPFRDIGSWNPLQLESYLLGSLRINMSDLQSLRKGILQSILKAAPYHRIQHLINILEEII